MAYEELIRNTLISVSFKYPKYKIFAEELANGTAGKAEKWHLVLGSISQTKSGNAFCNRIITDLWDTFTKEMYVDANGHIFNAQLMDAIAADPFDWNLLGRFNGTFEQKFVFLTRYALQYERPEFMYRRVALYTHSFVSERLHFTVDEYYDGLVQQDFSPSGQILRHIGTSLSTESCAVLREFRQKSCTEDHQTIKRNFMEHLRLCLLNYVGLGIELRSTENIEHYKFLADCMSASNRNIVANFNQSIADVRVLEVLLKSNSMAANVDHPSNHLFTIGILDDLMMAVRQDTAWGMFDTDDEIYSSAVYRKMKDVHSFAKTISARELMNVICQRILENGKPSIIFLDHMNRFSQFPNSQEHPIGSSNLCTEIALPMKDDECATCCVGTLNVKKICKKLPIRCTDIDLDALNTKTAMLVDILNTTQATSSFEYSRKYRPLAIGLLGFSDTFSPHENNVYNDLQVVKKLEMIMEAVYIGAIERSCDWGQLYTPFEDFEKSSWAIGKSQVELRQGTWKHFRPESLLVLKRARMGLYNLTLTGQPPTASISLLCNCSPSIEMPVTNSDNEPVAIKMFGSTLQMFFDSPFNAFRDSALADQLTITQSMYLDQSSSTNLYVPSADAHHLANRLGKLWKRGVKTGAYYTRTQQNLTRSMLMTEADCDQCNN
ncbi:unnamed protein product [Ceutorhynchus assimilis]|uniref:Ribonucleoside-diphosphate reductase n=1 Tax=Ceutorhynchus assimilis TaxID=467358 RepID=A0A9N9MX99_9CUCU|nr:unnamed protein product [Ceutorhynchus assimilis]